MNEENAITFLDILDRESFSTESSKANAKAALSLFGVDIIDGGEFDWDSFKETRERIFRKQQFQSNQSKSLDVVQRKLSDNSSSSFNACIKQCMTKTGLFATIIDYTDKYTYLKVNYFPSEDASFGSAIVRKIDPGENAILDDVENADFPLTVSPGPTGRVIKLRRARSIRKDNVIIVKARMPNGRDVDITVRQQGTQKLTILDSIVKPLPDTLKLIHVIEGLAILDIESMALRSTLPCTGRFCVNDKVVVKENKTQGQVFKWGIWQNQACGHELQGPNWHLTNWGTCCCGAGSSDRGLQHIKAVVMHLREPADIYNPPTQNRINPGVRRSR